MRSLADKLRSLDFEVDIITVPFAWHSRDQVLTSALLWRALDLTESDGKPIDLVIGTKFPSYVVRHPNKVVWLVHQFRQVYELLGTPYSDFGALPEDEEVVERLREIDRRVLGEARRVFTISGNTAARLRRFLGIESEALYPPPMIGERLDPGPAGDYVLSVGRLNPMKRTSKLVEAMAASRSDIRCKIVGTGSEAAELASLAERLGVVDRIDFVGVADDGELTELYRRALAVYYSPFDEDYGYVTVEAMLAGKPVVTMEDSGGVLEFVRDGINGAIVPANDAKAVAKCLDQWRRSPEAAVRLGAAGRKSVEDVTWDNVLGRLLETL